MVIDGYPPRWQARCRAGAIRALAVGAPKRLSDSRPSTAAETLARFSPAVACAGRPVGTPDAIVRKLERRLARGGQRSRDQDQAGRDRQLPEPDSPAELLAFIQAEQQT